jgi:hypothetical protein
LPDKAITVAFVDVIMTQVQRFNKKDPRLSAWGHFVERRFGG